MKAWYAISVLFLCFACFFAGRYSVEKQIEVVKETDTINKPVPEPSYILDVEEIELPYPIFVYQKGDTVKELDTIYIPLPIQRYGIGKNGFSPYIGVGLYYRIW